MCDETHTEESKSDVKQKFEKRNTNSFTSVFLSFFSLVIHIVSHVEVFFLTKEEQTSGVLNASKSESTLTQTPPSQTDGVQKFFRSQRLKTKPQCFLGLNKNVSVVRKTAKPDCELAQLALACCYLDFIILSTALKLSRHVKHIHKVTNFVDTSLDEVTAQVWSFYLIFTLFFLLLIKYLNLI